MVDGESKAGRCSAAEGVARGEVGEGVGFAGGFVTKDDCHTIPTFGLGQGNGEAAIKYRDSGLRPE
jgi:hypothetical protein